MSRPYLTRRAKADLDEIWDSVVHRSEQAADELIAEILAVARRQAQFPGIGRPRNDLLPELRSFVVQKYIVFFRAREQTIEILRILHGSRQIDSDLITQNGD